GGLQPFQERLDVLDQVAVALPVVEEELHLDGLWLDAAEFGRGRVLGPLVGGTVPGRRLADRVLLGVEAEAELLRAVLGRQAGPHAAPRKPWCASSRDSLATWLPPVSRLGPVHFTGQTPVKFQRQTTSPLASMTVISAFFLSTLLTIPDTHLTTAWESLSSGRVSLTLG